MAGPELILGVAGLLTPLLAAPVGSAVRKRFHKPRYDYYSDREEVCGNFIESWTSLHSSVLRLLSVIRMLAHDDQDRRSVLKELERATKVFQDVSSHLLACKPIGNALREQEKTNHFLEAIGKKLGATVMIAEEKIAAMLELIVAEKLSSSTLSNLHRENDIQTTANRGPQNMGHVNPKFYDESFFECSQFPQFFQDTSPRLHSKQDSKHTRNTTSHYNCDGLPSHHYRKKRHHNSSSSPSSSPFCKNCSQGSFRDFSLSYGERYLDRDQW